MLVVLCIEYVIICLEVGMRFVVDNIEVMML